MGYRQKKRLSDIKIATLLTKSSQKDWSECMEVKKQKMKTVVTHFFIMRSNGQVLCAIVTLNRMKMKAKNATMIQFKQCHGTSSKKVRFCIIILLSIQ